MNQKQFLIRGTVLLTAAGIISRLLGFFYRIFLSRTIGAEGLGIYQLILPVSAFCTALASGGIETAVSRFCAEYHVKKEWNTADRILAGALLLSISSAILAGCVVYRFADWIAISFLAEPRCAALLRITAFSLPFCVIHACFGGYFVGMKRVKIPAAAQMAEQLARIGSVLLICRALLQNGQTPTVSTIALGQVAGELASALLCTLCYLGMKQPDEYTQQIQISTRPIPLSLACRKILQVSTPLALNRMLLCVLQGIEAALLPQQIARHGLSTGEALSAYGTLSGMALPLLLFPTAITGSLGTLLLPAISEARVTDDNRRLNRTIESSFGLSFLLGIFCFGIFSLFGTEIGYLLFESRLAGQYITSLAWLCPFLYLNTTLVHILHGLGKTFAVSLQSTLGFLVRLSSVVLLVPAFGIEGYFLGLFAGELLIFGASLYTLHRNAPLHLSAFSVFLKPLAACILAISCVCLLRSLAPYLQTASWCSLILCVGIFSSLFLAAVYVLLPEYRIKIGIR